MKTKEKTLSVDEQIKRAVAYQQKQKTQLKQGVGASMLRLKNKKVIQTDQDLDKKLDYKYYNNRYMRLNDLELEYIQSRVKYDYKALEIKINDELCRRIIEFPYYVVSPSARIYRTVPINHKELYCYRLNPDQKYHIEKKCGTMGGSRRMRASLTDEFGKLHNIMLARIVYQYFGEKPNPHNFVLDYKDGNIENCHIDNLILTDKYHTLARLNLRQVNQIKKLIKHKYPLRSIALLYDVSEMYVSRIKSGETWSKKGRIVPQKLPPFYVEDAKIRRILGYFDFVYDEKYKRIKRKLIIIRDCDDPTNNKITGIYKGFKLSKKHGNITRAKEIADKINSYLYE